MSTLVQIPDAAVGQKLSDWLLSAGYTVPAPCGGRGTCRKCAVHVLRGAFDPPVDENGDVLACRATCPPGGAEILLPDNEGEGLTTMHLSGRSSDAAPDHPARPGDSAHLYGVALDIGTTTLAAALVDRTDGRILSTASCLNPQQSLGADVISRIGACKEGHLPDLQRLVLDAVRHLLHRLCPGETPDMAVAGNPTMLHLFCGVSPEGMGAYPFTPAFLDVRHLSGAELGLPAGQITLLPAVSAFVGSDITAGMLVSHMDGNAPVLLMDIGTNGEMVLYTGATGGHTFFAASTAAGPALEGANISCGMGGVDGAVSSVRRGEDETLIYRTIGDSPARGLCGCGLMDLVACLCDAGMIDETGYPEPEPPLADADGESVRLYGQWERSHGECALPADTPVTLTPKDIREVQLAKSALRAGLEALLVEAGTSTQDFVAAGGRLCLAGGLGFYLNPHSAARIGLLPAAILPAVRAVGNSALAGAVRALHDPSAVDTMATLATACRVIELNRSPVFNDGFIEHMTFPSPEETI